MLGIWFEDGGIAGMTFALVFDLERSQIDLLFLIDASPKDTLLGSIAEFSLVGIIRASAYTLSGVLLKPDHEPFLFCNVHFHPK